MRIGVDVRKLGDGGIGEYIRETLVAAKRLSPALEIVAFGEPGARERLPIADAEWIDLRAAKYGVAEHWRLPSAARRARVDLFHAPHYVLPLGFSGPSVVTVHDLIHVLLPRSPLHAAYARWMIRSACGRARRVIAVSETTASDLETHLGVAREKIRVVWNGVAPRFRRLGEEEVDAALAALGICRPYVLFVGNCLPHKNVETLVRAWGALSEPRPALVLCGRSFRESPSVTRALGEVSGRERVKILDAVTPDGLVPLYNGAECLVSTSRYEGFCLPVVEAFACGTPVLGPEAGAVPEIAGDAALLVPPERVDLIASGMYRLLRDRELRRGLVERGLRRGALFSWEEAARKTLSTYEEVGGRP